MCARPGMQPGGSPSAREPLQPGSASSESPPLPPRPRHIRHRVHRRRRHHRHNARLHLDGKEWPDPLSKYPSNTAKVWQNLGEFPQLQAKFSTHVTALERVPIMETAAKAVVKSSSSKMSDTALHSSIDSDQSYLREAAPTSSKGQRVRVRPSSTAEDSEGGARVEQHPPAVAHPTARHHHKHQPPRHRPSMRFLPARCLLALLEECNPDASNAVRLTIPNVATTSAEPRSTVLAKQ